MTVYSNTRLSAFQTCPRQYRFAYVEGIKRDTEGIEIFMGKRVHEVLEKLYKDIKLNKSNDLETLLGLYDKLWNENWHDAVRINNVDYTSRNYYDKGADCIKGYYALYHPFNHGIVMGIEETLRGYLDQDRKYEISGVVDRIDQRTGGIFEIHDYKTSNSLPTQQEADVDRQLALYQILLKQRWPDIENIELVWHYLGFNREIRSFRTEEQLEQTVAGTIQLIDQIEAAAITGEYPATESTLCGWCVYQDVCALKTHAVETGALPENEYATEDGVQLVAKFAELAAAKKQAKENLDKIEDELDKLKEAVIAYADRHGYEAIQGQDHRLAVKRKTELKFPDKEDSKRRLQLEELLHEIGKWNEVCAFDRHALKRVINEHAWPDELIDKIREFVDEEESVKVQLSKK